jgi:hypothetical protein
MTRKNEQYAIIYSFCFARQRSCSLRAMDTQGNYHATSHTNSASADSNPSTGILSE